MRSVAVSWCLPTRSIVAPWYQPTGRLPDSNVAERIDTFNGQTMDGAAVPTARSGALAAAIEFVRRNPGRVLGAVLGLHLVVWTVLPILVCPNLQLDLVEDLVLGKEWQLGYWKHPPLPWWIADLVYRLTGHIELVYVLGPLAAVVCLYAVWLLARDVLDPFQGLLAVLALEGLHYYNFSVVKFAHDQMQLPMWAFTGLFFYRALKRGRALDWVLAGAFLAGAFWSKYAAFSLAATLGLFLLADPTARRAWRTPGPYLMAITFAIVIAPNVWWLFGHDFMPFQYVSDRAPPAVTWYLYIAYPLQWIVSQIYFLLPAMGLLALIYFGFGARNSRTNLGRRCRIRPPHRDRARRRTVPCDHRGSDRPWPAGGRHVGLSAMVVRATRTDDVARASHRGAVTAALCGRICCLVRHVPSRLCRDRDRRTVLA